MNDAVYNYIGERMKQCEEVYHITVIAWFLRNRGILRKNSDLDIVFLFKNKNNGNCKAIHDIIGYGFDFWGWDIYDAYETILRSHEQFYMNPMAEMKDIYLSAEHKRGGLGYFGGLYWMVGNPEVGGNTDYLSNGVDLLDKLMERKIVVNYLIAPIRGRVDRVSYTNCMSSYEYLNTLWRLMLAKNILAGGKPGETDFVELIHRFVGGETLLSIKSLLIIYRRALSKCSQTFALTSLNSYISMEYDSIASETIKLMPEKEKSERDSMERLMKMTRRI